MSERNTVIMQKYSMNMQAPAKRQKLLRAINEVIEPIPKARTTEVAVIVIVGPARFTAFSILSSTGLKNGV